MTTKEVEAVIDDLEAESELALKAETQVGYARSLAFSTAAQFLRAALHRSQLAAVKRKTARRIRALDIRPSRKLS